MRQLAMAILATAALCRVPATASAPPAPVTISQFSAASSVWANQTAMTVNWNYSGTAPATQSVIVMLQFGTTTSAVSAAIPVANKTGRTSVYGWSASFKVNTPGALYLVDAQSKRTVSPTVPVTLSIR